MHKRADGYKNEEEKRLENNIQGRHQKIQPGKMQSNRSSFEGEGFAFIVTKSKGQKILKGNCGVFNFPKKQRKNFTNFCPSI